MNRAFLYFGTNLGMLCAGFLAVGWPDLDFGSLISAAENATLNGLDEVNKVAEEYLKKAPPPPPRKMWNDPTAGSSASAEAEESAWPRTKATGELLVDVYEAKRG